MHPSKFAVWSWPFSSSIYIHREFDYRRNRRRYFGFLKIIAVLCVLSAIGTHYINFTQTGLSASEASAAALQPETIPPDSNVPATVITPAKTDRTDQLQALLGSWASANSNAQWGVVVQQLGKGQAYADYQPGQSFYPASLYKLLLLQSLFEKLPFSGWNKSMGSSAGGMSYSTCIDRMLRLSDNDCGVAIGNYTGWRNANNRLKTMGLIGTSLNGSDQQLRTTAADVSTYLKFLFQSGSYPQAKAAVMSSMSQQVYRNGIPAGSPGCTVYDKIGDLNGYRHDAGIVECPNTSYSLTILSKGGSYSQIADLAQQVNSYFNQLP